MKDQADNPPTLLDGGTVHGEYNVAAKFRKKFHVLKS